MRLQLSKNPDSSWSWRRYDDDGVLVASSGKKTYATLKDARKSLRKDDEVEGVGEDEPDA
jgi:hypothetical protein